jgi:oligo-1,6-glucosidase
MAVHESDAGWFHSAVVYQIYPRSFADSDGDGVGDLGGILEHVDHLVDLGIDVVWLSPVYRSPMDDNGYDISDYQDVDPLFGTLGQLDELIAALHQRGIKLVMDLVVNHTSDEHPWFLESRSSRDSPKRDWYWWHDGADGKPPNNWQSAFSGSAWEWDAATQQFYLHLFSRTQPDLNWENPEVRHAVYAMMRWWLDRGVDGFRMDVINLISKAPELPDEDLDASWSALPYVDGPRIHEFLHEMRVEVFGDRPGRFLTVGEMPGTTVEEARLYTDPARREVDMVFQFEHVQIDEGPGGKWDLRPFALVALKSSMARWQEGLADVGWNSLYFDNHDQPRAVSRFGDDSPEFWQRSATALALVLHLHRGTPYVYQGDEIGMTNVPFDSIDDFRDIETLNHWAAAIADGVPQDVLMAAFRAKSRDNARTPMQWGAGPGAGFTTGIPWLSINPNASAINVEAQRDDPTSVYAFYRRLIALRHEERAIADGSFTLLHPDHPQLWMFRRAGCDAELLVAANFSRAEIPVEIDERSKTAEVLLANYPDSKPSRATLRPWEAWVTRRPVSG